MGYLFDAIRRAYQGQAPLNRPAAQSPAVSTPAVASAGSSPSAATAVTSPTPDSPPTPDLPAAGTTVLEPAPGETPAFHQDQVDRFDERLVTATDPAGLISEEYRAIRTSLLARWQNRRHLIHTITSALPQEGKTITSLNLGTCFAELRTRRTIVVEGDLRLPQFAKLLSLEESPGLVELLQGKAELSQIIHRVGPCQLDVVPAGQSASNEAVQLLSSPAMAQFLARLRQRYDHVIIDTPPVLELADAGILGAQSDEVLLVVRLNHTPWSLVEQALRVLASYNTSVTGLIATDHHHGQRPYYRYRYGYRYGYRYRYYYRHYYHRRRHS